MIWLDGLQVEDDDLLFPAQERGHLLGDGVFETLRVEKSKPLLLERHLKRLAGAAHDLRFKIDAKALDIQARQAAATIDTASMRITLLRGVGPRGLLPPSEPAIRTLIQVTPTGPRQPALRSVIISSVRRNEGSPLSRIKCVSYAEQTLARMEASDAGAEDAIMLNNRGEPASTSCANLLVRLPEGWVTPPVKTGLLPGIVREVLVEKGVVVEKPVSLEAVRTRPLLRTNSLIGIEPLQLDDGPVADASESVVLTEVLSAAEREDA